MSSSMNIITLTEWEAAMKDEKEVSYPLVLNEEGHYQENSDVNFDLPPIFDAYDEVDNEVNWSLLPRFDEHEPSPIQPSQTLKPQKALQKNLLLTSLLPTESNPSFYPPLTLFYQTHDHVVPQKMPYDFFPQRTPLHKIDLFYKKKEIKERKPFEFEDKLQTTRGE